MNRVRVARTSKIFAYLSRVVVASTLLFATGSLGCQRRAATPDEAVAQPKLVDVFLVSATQRDTGRVLVGHTEPWRETTLRFEVAGVVSDVFVESGSRVEAGDPIARLVLDDFRLEVERARRALEASVANWRLLRDGTRQEVIDAARAEFDLARARVNYWREEDRRHHELLKSEGTSESERDRIAFEFQSAREQMRAAKAQLARALAGPRPQEIRQAKATAQVRHAAWKLAQNRESKATLRAPFAGRIERRAVDPGTLITLLPTGGVPVAHLVDLQTIDVVAAIPEVSVHDFTVGQLLHVTSVVNKDICMLAEVVSVGSVANDQSGTYELRARIDNPRERLRAGMVVKVRPRQRPTATVIQIPSDAVRDQYGRPPQVLLVDPSSSTVVARNVELGPRHGTLVEIAGGLAEGEIVIRGDDERVVPGDHVEYDATR